MTLGDDRPFAASGVRDDLIDRARAGDAQAFTQLLQESDDRMRRLGYRLMRSTAAMEDALQDAYLKAYRSIGSFEHQSKFSTWLYSIVYRTCLDAIRYQDRRPVEQLNPGLAEPDHFVDQVVAANSVHQALDRLPVDQRAALLLVDDEGLSFAEAASVLDIPVGTAASRVSRARQTLRSDLQLKDQWA
ncbi:MAG: RNA polymerase sigma factor [Acidimicrobiales bacterium]